MSKTEEYTIMANAMSEETKELFRDGGNIIFQALDTIDVRYELTSGDLITLAKLGTLVKILPLFTDKKEEEEK